MRNFKVGLVGGLYCGAVIYTGAAWTQAAVPAISATDTIAEIIVTAEKRTERLQDVPMSLNAATGRQLQTLGITDTDQLQALVPGFSFEKTIYGLPVYFIRGIGFNDTTLGVSPGVTVYTDQFALPFSPMSRGAILDLERVEVLKGPQGTLFGENSTGGAINYIAAKPTDSFQAGVDATYGRFNEADAEAFVSGPLISTVSARLAVRNEHQGDWQKGYTSDESIGEKDFHNVRLLVDWKPRDWMKFELMTTGWIDDSETQQPQFVEYNPLATPAHGGRPTTFPIASFPAAPSDPRAAAWDPGSNFRQHDHFYQITLRGDLNIAERVTLTSLSSYEAFRVHAPINLDATTYPMSVATDGGNIESYSQELRVNGSTGERIKWMLGGNYERDTVDERLAFNPTQTSANHIGPLTFSSFLIDDGQTIESKSGFGSLDFGVSDSLTAQVSARYSAQDRSFAGCARDDGTGGFAKALSALSSALSKSPQMILPGNCATLSNVGTPLPIATGQLNQDNVSWRGSLNWKPNTETLFYANATKGYKAGSFPTLPAALARQFTPVPQESVLAYELGFRLDALSRSLQLDAAAFYYDYTDKQLVGYLVVAPFGPLPSLVSIPTAKVEGAEMSLTLHPAGGLTITANGTYVDTRVDSNPVNPTGPFSNPASFIGKCFPYTPRWQGVVDAQYRFPVSNTIYGFFGADVSSRSDTTGALLSGAAAVASQEALLKIPGYTLLGLRAGIEPANGPWRLEFWGRNVTNRFYETGATRNSDFVTRFAGMPLTYGITAHYSFGHQ
jgi:iron complex outermembrane receptor protein